MERERSFVFHYQHKRINKNHFNKKACGDLLCGDDQLTKNSADMFTVTCKLADVLSKHQSSLIYPFFITR